MLTDSIACFRIAAMFSFAAGKPPLPAAFRWTRRWWMLLVFLRLRLGTKWCCWGARAAKRSTPGTWRTFAGRFRGRYCVRSDPGFHVCFVIDNWREGIYGYHVGASENIFDPLKKDC